MLFTEKLSENKDFVRLYNKGAFVSCGLCTVYFRKNGGKRNRIGISTGKKIGGAVERSRARRVLRQSYRENEKDFPGGYDIVVCARQGCTTCKTFHVSRFFKSRVIPAMRDPEYKRKCAKK